MNALQCVGCKELFHPGEEAYLTLVRQVITVAPNELAIVGQGLEEYDVLDGRGGLAFRPNYLCIDCWDDAVQELHDLVKDEPAVTCPGGLLECSFCSSDILGLEYYVRAMIGEFQVSPRRPDGRVKFVFQPSEPKGKGQIFCISCMAYICLDIIPELWQEVTQVGECTDCEHARCWRDEACLCQCHKEAALAG